ncbi:hypothetical protein KP79_PYT04573 [Mizuhopecten yessoensis]|uniref:Uncharacterized protein n=1 Tax=Mizuhopecten yessoensis TaxID=6573 RepID=A0A210QWY5_MIZYE|nr:hypothetical protein KP79_PYT04573 [Mizuhopecten yessoensis]
MPPTRKRAAALNHRLVPKRPVQVQHGTPRTRGRPAPTRGEHQSGSNIQQQSEAHTSLTAAAPFAAIAAELFKLMKAEGMVMKDPHQSSNPVLPSVTTLCFQSTHQSVTSAALGGPDQQPLTRPTSSGVAVRDMPSHQNPRCQCLTLCWVRQHQI